MDVLALFVNTEPDTNARDRPAQFRISLGEANVYHARNNWKRFRIARQSPRDRRECFINNPDITEFSETGGIGRALDELSQSHEASLRRPPPVALREFVCSRDVVVRERFIGQEHSFVGNRFSVSRNLPRDPMRQFTDDSRGAAP